MRTMTGLSLKRPHVLYRPILFYLSIIGFVSISYSTVTIETTIFDDNSNGSISNVTGYFNGTNGIRITVTLTDDADGNHLTQFGNGKFSVWGCFTPGNQTPSTDPDGSIPRAWAPVCVSIPAPDQDGHGWDAADGVGNRQSIDPHA